MLPFIKLKINLELYLVINSYFIIVIIIKIAFNFASIRIHFTSILFIIQTVISNFKNHHIINLNFYYYLYKLVILKIIHVISIFNSFINSINSINYINLFNYFNCFNYFNYCTWPGWHGLVGLADWLGWASHLDWLRGPELK